MVELSDKEIRAAEKEKENLLRAQKKKLFEAAERDDLKTVKELVENENVPLKSYTEKELYTVAHIAAKNGYLDIVKYVADQDSAVLARRDRYGNTVLHVDAEKRVQDTVQYLEEKYKGGLSKWDRRDFESMAIHAAAQFGHWNILKYFVEQKNSDVDATNDQGDPPVFTAVKYKRSDVLKYLVEERRANLTMVNTNKDNILYVAVGEDDLPTMKYVLDERKAPIDVNWQNKFGNTLVHRAAILNRTSILEYLVEQKHADVNVQGHEKMTALNHASSRQNYEVCKYLVEHGADPNLKDKFGYYPFQKAFESRLVEYMRSLPCPPRSRRSVELVQPIRQPSEEQVVVGHLVEGRNTLHHHLYASQLPNFLLTAQWALGNAKGFAHQQSKRSIFSSSAVDLDDKIDSVAVDAVHTGSTFNDI